MQPDTLQRGAYYVYDGQRTRWHDIRVVQAGGEGKLWAIVEGFLSQRLWVKPEELQGDTKEEE